MLLHTREQIQREVDVIGRYAESYRRKFHAMIRRLNDANDSTANIASLHLCVEAVDMMLSSQSELARMLGEIAACQHAKSLLEQAA
jgi:hypothetical protein